MSYFPFFVDIGNKKCVIFGGGRVAARKAEKLLPFGCKITVIAPEISGHILAMKGIETICDVFRPRQAEDAFMVIAAADSETNRRISRFCRGRRIPVNVVDSPEESTFFFPALYKNGPVCAGISSGGKSPKTSAAVRSRLEEAIPPHYGQIAEKLGALREPVKRRVNDQNVREKIFSSLFDAMDAKKGVVTESEIEYIIRRENNENQNRDKEQRAGCYTGGNDR